MTSSRVLLFRNGIFLAGGGGISARPSFRLMDDLYFVKRRFIWGARVPFVTRRIGCNSVAQGCARRALKRHIFQHFVVLMTAVGTHVRLGFTTAALPPVQGALPLPALEV